MRDVRQAMDAAGVSALLITHLPDVRYLCGFTGSNAALAITAQRYGAKARLFTDGRYTAQAREEVRAAVGARVAVTISPKSALDDACRFAFDSGASACGFDPSHVTVDLLDRMKRTLRAHQSGVSAKFLRPFRGLISSLRERKDTAEVAALRRAALLGCKLYDGMLGWMESGMEERAVAAELEYRARLAGAEGMSFETIVAAGVRSSQPHARATSARIAPGDLLTLDFGIILDGYCSDMTRTVAFGWNGARVPRAHMERRTEQRRVFEAVLEAQELAVQAVRPGIRCGDLDEVARGVLRRTGLEKAFSHSLGHGLGLEIHEGPRIAAGVDTALEAGMVVTIEPGAYLPGRFGVRIEDTVLVTGDGVEVLTPSPKVWTEL